MSTRLAMARTAGRRGSAATAGLLWASMPDRASRNRLAPGSIDPGRPLAPITTELRPKRARATPNRTAGPEARLAPKVKVSGPTWRLFYRRWRSPPRWPRRHPAASKALPGDHCCSPPYFLCVLPTYWKAAPDRLDSPTGRQTYPWHDSAVIAAGSSVGRGSNRRPARGRERRQGCQVQRPPQSGPRRLGHGRGSNVDIGAT